MTIDILKHLLLGQTIVSIQPVPNSPLDNEVCIVAMAQAAEQAGAAALRIEGVSNVQSVTKAVSIPIIGIVKRELENSEVRITPFASDVNALSNAGATIIAFDATDRPRPESREHIAQTIQDSNCFAMADSSCFEDGQWANNVGVEIIGSTLSGYISEPTPEEPDFELIKRFSKAGFFTMAEGRFNTPELAAKAIKMGATAVTVGSALTRLEIMIDWFNTATRNEVL